MKLEPTVFKSSYRRAKLHLVVVEFSIELALLCHKLAVTPRPQRYVAECVIEDAIEAASA